MVELGPQAPISTTSHCSTAHMRVLHTHGVWAAALYRCALCMWSAVGCHLVYVWAVCLLEPRQKNRQHFTGTYVQNKPARTETRQIAWTTPTESKITLKAGHAP